MFPPDRGGGGGGGEDQKKKFKSVQIDHRLQNGSV